MTQRSVTIEIRPADSEEAVASTRLLLKEYASALGRHLSFEEFARELLDKEVLGRSDIDRIMEGVKQIDRRPSRGLRVVASDPTPPAAS